MRGLRLPPAVHREVMREIGLVMHLPLWQRLCHVKSRRVVMSVMSGVAMMVCGSTVAHAAHAISEVTGAHPILVDTAGYFIHGVGSIPLLRYCEPFWSLVFGE